MDEYSKPIHSAQTRRHDLPRGFSVLELMASLTIAGIATWIAAPHLFSFLNQTYLKGEATSVRLFIESAYAYALSSRERVLVALNEHYLVGQLDSGTIIGRYTLRNKVTLDPDSVSSQTVALYPSISASPATITLHRGSTICQVVISLRGRVRVSC